MKRSPLAAFKCGDNVFRLEKQYLLIWTMTRTRLWYKGCDHITPLKYSLWYLKCTSLHRVSILQGAKFLSQCSCLISRVKNLYIMSEFGTYQSLRFWQMTPLIEDWISPESQEIEVCLLRYVMIGFPLQGNEIQMCGVSATGLKRGYSNSHMWGHYVSHTLKV